MVVSSTDRAGSFQQTTPRSRTRRSKRWFGVDALETRTLLSYTFAYSNPNDVTVNESGGSDSFNVIQSGGQLEYSINGGAFSADWGGPGNVVDASSLTSVFINLTADNSAIILGNPTSPASSNLALFSLSADPGNANDSLTINDGASTLSGGSYDVNTSRHMITGPASGINVTETATIFGGGTVLEANGAGNTLNYNSAAVTPTVTSIPGGVQITTSTAGNLSALNFNSINVSNVPATTITPGPAVTINNIGGLTYTNAIVGTFTMPLGSIIPPPAGLPATDFTATINWGDGSPTTSATVVQDASNPSVYDIVGSHTYSTPGTFTVANTVAFTGGTISDPVSSSTVSVIFPPVGPTAGTAATIVTDPLTAVTGVALTPAANTGVLFTNSLVGKFTDANTSEPASDFTAVIDWGDGSATSLGTVVSTGAGAFSVEGTHAYTKFGSYITTVNVTDVNGAAVTLTGTAAVTDLPVTGAVRSFSAIEGRNTGTIVLGTFTDPNPLATAADVTATLPIDGWGDATPPSVVTLAVQPIGATSAGTLFEVLGAHTYADTGSFTVNINVSTLDSGPTALTAGTATVVDATITGSTGITFKGTEGIATPATPLIGTFTDSDPSATVADYTAGTGSVVVNWGDGSALQTMTAANLTANNSVDNTVFSIDASHTYPDEGFYPVTIAVTDTDGATTTISSSAIIADAPLSPFNPQPGITQVQPTIFPVPQFGTPAFSGPVAYFSDAAGAAGSAADFTATIDWGDGTALSAGTISAGPAGSPVGTYTVSGSHTYAEQGTYPVEAFIVDTGGSRLTGVNTAAVTALPLSVTGAIDPSSDSGLSTGHPDVTRFVQPTFTGTVVSTLPTGTTTPEADARVTLTTTINGVSTTIGTGTTNSQGAWSITSTVPLQPDGTYAISATATDQFGNLTTTSTIVPSLLVDTTGPVITGAFFNHLNGQVDFTIQDPSPASGPPSGVWVNTLLDSSNYLLTKVHANKAYPGKWIVTNVTATPGAAAGSYDVAVTFNSGKPIKGGFYLFTIRDSSNGNSSVQDNAENHLDGVFYGTFPSGNGINGSDFVAELDAYHDKVFAPQTIVGTSSAANGGVGGTPVGFVHSGVFSPAVPRGGSPVFGTTSTTADRRLAALEARSSARSRRLSHEAKSHTVAHQTKTRGQGNEVKTRAASHPHGPLHS
jgi:large repetitive protein